MPATVFPAPGTVGSVQWNTYTTTATASSSTTTVTLSGKLTDSRFEGLTPSVTSGTGTFASNTVIMSAPFMNTYSASFNGTSQYLTVPSTGTNAAFTFAGNFTVEGWYYPTSTTGDHAIFCLGTETTNRYVWYISSGGQISSNLFGAATKNYTVTTIPINTWTHIAIVRTTSTVTVYVNGVASVTTDTQAGTIGNGVAKIGSDSGGTASFAGYISNFRVASIAVYTSAFNPSTNPLTSTQTANTNGNPSVALTLATQTSVLTCQSATIVDNGGSTFTIANSGTVLTNVTTVPGNTFTVNIAPTVALSSASISIANGSMNVISDNRSIPKISAIARVRPSSTTDVLSITDGLFAATQIFTVRSTSNADVLSVTDGQLAKQLFTLRDTSGIDQISRTDGSMTKQLFTLRDTSKTNYVNNSLVKGGGAGAASGISIREFRANIAQAGQTDTVSTTDGAIVKQLFTLRDTSRIDQISRTDGSMTKQLFVLRDSTVTVRKPDRAESNTGGNATANSSIVTTLYPTNLPPTNIAQTYFYSILAPGDRYSLSVEQGRLSASPTVNDAVSSTDGKLKSISSLRSPGTDRYVTVGSRLKSIAAIRDVRPTIPTNRIESTARLYSTIPSGAPSTALDRLFYFTAVPGLRYNLSTEQGVRPTPTPFVANANAAIPTTSLRGSIATTSPLAITTSGGTYTGFSGFTGYRIPAVSAPSVQPGLIVTAAATASGTSVLSNTATVAFVSYVDAAATPAIYVFFSGTPISAWLNGYTMTLSYPNSTTIGNAVTPTTTIDTYNRFLLAPGMRYSLSTEQGYLPTRSMNSDVLSRTDGLFSNVYLQNGFFIYASQSGNLLSIQGNATGYLSQFGGSTIGTTYTQPFGGILKTGKTIYGPGGATATIVNQRFSNPANYDVTLTSPAYSYTITTLTLPSVTGMYQGSPIRFTAAVTNTNLTANTTYYVTSVTGTTITLTTTSPGNSNITVAAGSGSGTLAGNAYYGTINQGQPEGAAQDATTSVYATYMVNTSQTVTTSIWFVPSDASFSNRPTNSRDSLNTFLMAPGLRYSLAKEQGEGDLHNNLASAATARGVLTNPALTAYQATNTQYWTASTYNTLPTAYRLKESLTLGDVVKDVRLTVDNGKITASYVSADSIQANYTNRPQTARDNLWTFQMAPGLRYSLSTEQGKIPTQPSNLRLVQDSFNPLVFKWGYGTKGGSMQDPSFKKKPPIQFWN